MFFFLMKGFFFTLNSTLSYVYVYHYEFLLTFAIVQ